MRNARIGVAATAVWRSPDAAGTRDAPVTRPAPDPAAWTASLDRAAREDLVQRIDTQALLGEPVLVVAEDGSWAHVRLPWQPSTGALDGYPGWIPTAHLVDDPGSAPCVPSDGAVVITRLLDARADDGERIQLSFGTVLAVATAEPLTLRHPDGRTLAVDRSAIRVPREKPGADPTQLAHLFLGLPYLWAGLSGHGVDCSGFVHLINRAAGRVIPRDAHDQSVAGEPVAGADVLAGDAVYFENTHGVHHTGFALDRERLLHSPRTGKDVGFGSITADYPGELHAFRRFTER